MTTLNVRKLEQLDSDKADFRLQGISGTASANTTTNIDWKFPEERWINGGQLLCKGHIWGDTITVQLIDKDNVLGYGANTVLNTFTENFAVSADVQQQILITLESIALVPANVYFRIKYTNTNLLTSVSVAFNLFSHLPKM